MQPAQRPQTQAKTVTVHARFFALYRERVGQNALEIDMPEGATVGGLVAEVLRRYPAFSPVPSSIVVAVNREYATHDYFLGDGDEAAFIPPVSGGA